MDLLYGKQFSNYVEKINILLVGVGGIGCEILKVLQKYKVNSIHIVIRFL